jgi:hypothetical protein
MSYLPQNIGTFSANPTPAVVLPKERAARWAAGLLVGADPPLPAGQMVRRRCRDYQQCEIGLQNGQRIAGFFQRSARDAHSIGGL